MSTTIAGDQPEKLFFNISTDWYKGSFPGLPDVRNQRITKLLKENFTEIQSEIQAYYDSNSDSIKPNFTPYAYREEGWRTINLCSYFLKYPKKIKHFPKLWAVLSELPEVATIQIAVLKPGTRIKAHFGDTNAIIRYHLGVKVPGTLPEIGLRVGRENQGWAEGEVFALMVAVRHYAWNYTDDYRIVLVVDGVRDQYVNQKYWIAGKVLSAIGMRFFATKFPILKKMPRWMGKIIHVAGGVMFTFRLWLQRIFGI